MAQSTNVSFIPKAPIQTTPKRYVGGGSVSIVFIIAMIIMVGAIAVSVGLFLYQQYLLQTLEDKRIELEQAKKAFEPEILREIGRLDARIQSAVNILDEHKAMTALFALLEETTIENIQFETLTYSIEQSDRNQEKVDLPFIKMHGKASGFSSVALQSDVFGKNEYILDPIFSGLNLDTKGNVVFDVSAFIDTDLILYKNKILDVKNN